LRLADFAITQFFFDALDYRRMMNELADLDVSTPVIVTVWGVFQLAALNVRLDGLTVPLQEQSVDVDAMAQLLLSAGTRLNIEPRDLVTTELVPA